MFTRDNKPDEKPIEIAARLAKMLSNEPDVCVAVFVFRKQADDVDIGWIANTPAGQLRAWMTSWLIRGDDK